MNELELYQQQNCYEFKGCIGKQVMFCKYHMDPARENLVGYFRQGYFLETSTLINQPQTYERGKYNTTGGYQSMDDCLKIHPHGKDADVFNAKDDSKCRQRWMISSPISTTTYATARKRSQQLLKKCVCPQDIKGDSSLQRSAHVHKIFAYHDNDRDQSQDDQTNNVQTKNDEVNGKSRKSSHTKRKFQAWPVDSSGSSIREKEKNKKKSSLGCLPYCQYLCRPQQSERMFKTSMTYYHVVRITIRRFTRCVCPRFAQVPKQRQKRKRRKCQPLLNRQLTLFNVHNYNRPYTGWFQVVDLPTATK